MSTNLLLRSLRRLGLVPALFALACLIIACSVGGDDGSLPDEQASEATPTPALTPSAIPTATPSPTPTPSPVPTATPTPTVTPTATPTATPVGVLTEPPWKPFEPVTFVELSVPEGGSSMDLAPYEAPSASRSTRLFHELPDGERLEYPLRSPTFFGNPLVLVAIEGVDGDEFVRVLSPVRPIGTNVWVRTRDELSWHETTSSVHVVLAERLLELYEGCALQASLPVQVGNADSPTPTGFTWIDEILPGRPRWGEWIFSLAMFSDTFSTFDNDGSDGIAKLAVIGDAHLYYESSGVLRLHNADLTVLHDFASVGTPVTVWATREAFDAAATTDPQPDCAVSTAK